MTLPSRRAALASLGAVLITSIALACGTPGPSCATANCACGPSGCLCPNGSSCGWTAAIGCADDGSGCHLQCAARACAASCGGVCEAACTSGAGCEVIATEDATLYCASSTCEMTAAARTSARCVEGATCRIDCTALPCGVDCSLDSTCSLRCPGETSFATVVGAAACP